MEVELPQLEVEFGFSAKKERPKALLKHYAG